MTNTVPVSTSHLGWRPQARIELPVGTIFVSTEETTTEKELRVLARRIKVCMEALADVSLDLFEEGFFDDAFLKMAPAAKDELAKRSAFDEVPEQLRKHYSRYDDLSCNGCDGVRGDHEEDCPVADLEELYAKTQADVVHISECVVKNCQAESVPGGKYDTPQTCRCGRECWETGRDGTTRCVYCASLRKE